MITKDQLENIDKDILFIEYQKVCTELEKMQADYKILKELYIQNTQSLLEAQNQIIKNYNNALDNIRITVPNTYKIKENN